MFLLVLSLSVFGDKCGDLIPEDHICLSPCLLENESCVDECSTEYFLDEGNTSCIFDCSNVIYDSSAQDPCPEPCKIEWGTCVNKCDDGFVLTNPIVGICDVVNCSSISQKNNTCPYPECFIENDGCVTKCSTEYDEGTELDKGKCLINCSKVYPDDNGTRCLKPCLLEGFTCVSECDELFKRNDTNPTVCIPKTCDEFEPTTTNTSWASCHSTINYECYVQNNTCVQECDEGYEVVKKQCRAKHNCTLLNYTSEDCQWTCFVQENSICVYNCPEGFGPDEDLHYCVLESTNTTTNSQTSKGIGRISLIAIFVPVGAVVVIVFIVVVVCVVRRGRGSGKQRYTDISDGRVLEAYE